MDIQKIKNNWDDWAFSHKPIIGRDCDINRVFIYWIKEMQKQREIDCAYTKPCASENCKNLIPNDKDFCQFHSDNLPF